MVFGENGIYLTMRLFEIPEEEREEEEGMIVEEWEMLITIKMTPWFVQDFKKSQKELEKVDFKSRMGERSAHRGKNWATLRHCIDTLHENTTSSREAKEGPGESKQSIIHHRHHRSSELGQIGRFLFVITIRVVVGKYRACNTYIISTRRAGARQEIREGRMSVYITSILL
jgi:hypothetical protein